jgi:hypothetical protein
VEHALRKPRVHVADPALIFIEEEATMTSSQPPGCPLATGLSASAIACLSVQLRIALIAQ